MRQARIAGIRSLRIAVFFFLPLLSSAASLDAPSPQPAPRPFAPGERLTYALTYLTMRAGTAVMEVQEAPAFNGHRALKLLTTAKSSPVVTKFYPVDNRVESTIDAETLAPYHLLFSRREGKKHDDFDVTFHHDEHTVTSIKDGNGETVPIPPNTHDLISCLYYVRSLPSVDVGSSVVLNIHHDKKNYRVEVRIEGMERLHTAAGDRETIRLLVIMPFQGLFLNEGNIRVWLTNDERRVPIMMKAKVIIGSVVARLIE